MEKASAGAFIFSSVRNRSVGREKGQHKPNFLRKRGSFELFHSVRLRRVARHSELAMA